MPKQYVPFSDLLGKTLKEVVIADDKETITFTTVEGRVYEMYHVQDCCEHVTVEDVCGELSDLLGTPILQAEESTSNENPPGVKPACQDSFTWTFYRITTMKGQVVLRWYGESNGYYSEDVSFALVN